MMLFSWDRVPREIQKEYCRMMEKRMDRGPIGPRRVIRIYEMSVTQSPKELPTALAALISWESGGTVRNFRIASLTGTEVTSFPWRLTI